MAGSNEYLQRVVKAQEKVDEELRAFGGSSGRESAIDYRVTGFWRFKTVVVPPNVHVIHTRRGHEKPLHVGLGLSFKYDPYTDAFLLVPAAVQTLLISANCACIERQGILVQAYVQWIIGDITTAYRKLDFSNSRDPMRLINIQLREQAEAAVKDKVSTMSIEDVLSDKQPIIKELTQRLRSVAEGSSEEEGLGLKIVTVQIKEAVVSSTSLWENLQKPFRAERQKVAQLSELEAQREISARELANRHSADAAQIESKRKIELTRQEADLELYLKEMEAKRQRIAGEVETLRAEEEKARTQGETEMARARAETAARDFLHEAECERLKADVEIARLKRHVENDLSGNLLASQLVTQLPEVARALPKPDELRSVSVSTGASGLTDPLVQFIAVFRTLLGAFSAQEKEALTALTRQARPDTSP